MSDSALTLDEVFVKVGAAARWEARGKAEGKAEGVAIGEARGKAEIARNALSRGTMMDARLNMFPKNSRQQNSVRKR